jgi:hypothetical protein
MRDGIGEGKRRRPRTLVGGMVLAAVLILCGCSRSGTLSGEVAIRTPSGEVTRGARISVFLVHPSEAFEREWADVVAAFRQEVTPAAEAQKAAMRQAEEARLAWDRTLTARGRSGARRSQWTLTLRDASAASSPPLWRNVRGTEAAAYQAQNRVWEIIRRHEDLAHALVEKHATQRVQTDETGHYVIVKVPVSKVYVYARLREGKADFVWFLPIQAQTGTQRADLTQDNQRNWSFIP